MNYLDTANSPMLFIMAALVILMILVQSVYFLILAIKRGKEIGITKEQIQRTVKTSAVFSIVPSLPILISLVAIAPVLGIPFSWLRLSVIGSASYELIAADIGARSMGVEKLGAAGYTQTVFANSMWVMSIGIIWGLIACIFFLKRYQSKIKSIQKKDSGWAEILVNALFFGMLSVFLGKPIAGGGIQLYVLISSGLIMLAISFLGNKLKLSWLNDFALALSMVGGMALAILYTNIV